MLPNPAHEEATLILPVPLTGSAWLMLSNSLGDEVMRLAEQAPSVVSVVPNPASDEATLVLTRTLAEQGVLMAYNAVGEEVMRVAIPMDTPRMTFNTSSLAPALYYYKVLLRTGVLGNGKLTIVR